MCVRHFTLLVLISGLALAEDDELPPRIPSSTQTVVLDRKVLVANSEDVPSSFAVSPDGQLIALFNRDAHRVRINDVSGIKPLMTLENRDPKEFVWSPDSSTLILREIFNEQQAPKARVLFVRPKDKSIREVAWDPIMRMVATADGRALVQNGWSLGLVSPEGATTLLKQGVNDMFLWNQTVIVSEATGLFAFDLARPTELRTLATFEDKSVGFGLFTSDGQTIWVNRSKELVIVTAGKKTSVPMPATLERIKGLAASPNGAFLAVWSESRTVVLELSTRKVLFETKSFRRPRWTRDSSALWVPGLTDPLLKVPVATWQPSPVKPGHAGSVIDVSVLGNSPVFEVQEFTD